MNVFTIILLIFLYLAIGAIIGGLMDFGDDMFVAMILWPIIVAIYIVYYMFKPFIKFGGWISDKCRRYRFKRKEIKDDRT